MVPVFASKRLRIPVSDSTYNAPPYATSVGKYVPLRGCDHAINSPSFPSSPGVKSPVAPGLIAKIGLPFPPFTYNRPSYAKGLGIGVGDMPDRRHNSLPDTS